MIFRVRFRQLGGHVHCRVFQAAAPGQTWQKNGDLAFDLPAWEAAHPLLSLCGFDVLPEEDALDETALVPDCICRSCGHSASRHRGSAGECVVLGCSCGPGGWT